MLGAVVLAFDALQEGREAARDSVRLRALHGALGPALPSFSLCASCLAGFWCVNCVLLLPDRALVLIMILSHACIDWAETQGSRASTGAWPTPRPTPPAPQGGMLVPMPMLLHYPQEGGSLWRGRRRRGGPRTDRPGRRACGACVRACVYACVRIIGVCGGVFFCQGGGGVLGFRFGSVWFVVCQFINHQFTPFFSLLKHPCTHACMHA